MTKITKARLESEIRKQTNVLIDTLDKLGERVRVEHVIPFCQRSHLDFSAGMGSWSFHYARQRDTESEPSSVVDEEDLPQSLLDLLNQDYPLNPGQTLGSTLQSYKYRLKVGDAVTITQAQAAKLFAEAGPEASSTLPLGLREQIGEVARVVAVEVRGVYISYRGRKLFCVTPDILTPY